MHTKIDCERLKPNIDWNVRSVKFYELVRELDGINAMEEQYAENYIGLQTALKSVPQSPQNGWDHFNWLADHRNHLIAAKDGRFSNSKNVKAWHDWNGKSGSGEIMGVIEWLKGVYDDSESGPHFHKDDWVANSFLEAVQLDLNTKVDGGLRILICNESDLMKGIEDSLVSALTEIFTSAKIMYFKNLPEEKFSTDDTDLIVKSAPFSAAAMECVDYSFIIDPREDELISLFNRSFVNRETGELSMKPSEDFDPLVDYSCFDVPSLSLLNANVRKSRPQDGLFSIRVPFPNREVFSVNEVKDMIKSIDCRKDDKRISVSEIRSRLSHIPDGSLDLCINRYKSVLADTDHCFATLMNISASTALDLHYMHGRTSYCHEKLEMSSASKTHEKYFEILDSVGNFLKAQKEEEIFHIESLHRKVREFLATLENELVQVELIRIANKIDFINSVARALHAADSDTSEPINTTTISLDLVEKVRATCEFPPDLLQFWESLLNIVRDDDVINLENTNSLASFFLNEKDWNTILQETAKFEIFFVMKKKVIRVKDMVSALSSELTSSINNSVRFMRM
jgi:hypothetical protein